MEVLELYLKTYNDFEVRVYQIKKINTIVYEMRGEILEDRIHDFFVDLLEQVEIHRPKAMVADARKMKKLNKKVQKVVQTTFWPNIAKLGVVYNPTITPENVPSLNSVDHMIETVIQTNEMVKNQLTFPDFITVDSCLAWIAHQMEQSC